MLDAALAECLEQLLSPFAGNPTPDPYRTRLTAGSPGRMDS